MSPIFLSAAAVLVVVFACLAIVCWQKCAAALSEMRGVVSSLRSMRGKVEAHDAEIEALTDALHQLRGKFYAERRKSQTPNAASSDSSPPAQAASTKDELRRRIGLVPGRPAPHQE